MSEVGSDAIACDQCNTLLSDCFLATLLENTCENSFRSEWETLFDEKFSSMLELPLNERIMNIDNYYLHDSRGHLVYIDSGLIESGKEVFLVGNVELINDGEKQAINHIITREIGPLIRWSIKNFGQNLIMLLESQYCVYNLLKCHQKYRKFDYIIKIALTENIIEFVCKNSHSQCEELLEFLRRKDSQFETIELVNNIQYILDEIETIGDEIFESPLIQQLIEFCVQKTQNKLHLNSIQTCGLNQSLIARRDRRKLNNSDTYMACSSLVASFFGQIFEKVMNKNSSSNRKEKKSLANQRIKDSQQINQKIKWLGKVKHVDQYSRRTYYEGFQLNDKEFFIGDVISLYCSKSSNTEIGRIVTLYDDLCGGKYGHINWLIFSEDTFLGETGPPKEVFLLAECSAIDLYLIDCKLTVNYHHYSPTNIECDHFYCNRIHSRKYGFFTSFDANLREKISAKVCFGCLSREKDFEQQTIKVFDQINIVNSTKYFKFCQIGESLYEINTFALINCKESNLIDYFTPKTINYSDVEVDYDQELYPERYRKKFNEYIKGTLDDCPPILIVVKIISIQKSSSDPDDEAFAEVLVFYRPQNCFKNLDEIINYPLNELFITDIKMKIECSKLVYNCSVNYKDTCSNYSYPFNCHKQFICNKRYDSLTGHLLDCSQSELGLSQLTDKENDLNFKPLKCLDLFAGCGGLSHGFEKSGLCLNKWAVEKDPNTAKSFQANFPEATVYNDDCNLLFQKLTNGSLSNLPGKGDVEMILAGPPCQGYSSLNRFSRNIYSTFKNSLVATFLSYVDYYRPKLVVFENVRDFVQFEKNKIFKLTISCLLKMDYQVNFGVTQAGLYGLPQSRRRIFIIASSPEILLPNLPQPNHIFSKRCTQLDINVADKKIFSQIDISKGFLRPTTVSDAICDLSFQVENSIQHLDYYKCDPITDFQKLMRKSPSTTVSLHISPKISELIQSRIDHIPYSLGADWRDLPNISMVLSSGLFVEKLKYNYKDAKYDDPDDARFRGVCKCASGNLKDCNKSQSRQENTLIPWGFVHTANRNYQWSGLFGRLQWNGIFNTTITKTVPSSKQGCILHPSHNRTISIRECARSQSFPDNYQFFGSPSDIIAQIGNAVPPLMAQAIGLHIKQSLLKK